MAFDTNAMANADTQAKKLTDSMDKMQRTMEEAFGNTSKAMDKWAKNISSAVGTSKTEVEKFDFSIGSMVKNTISTLSNFNDAASTIADFSKGISSLGKDLGTLSDQKAGKALEGIGNDAEKALPSVSDLSQSLFSLASPGGIAVMAVGAALAIGGALMKMDEEAKKANMAKHFGSITLSAEELEATAKRITSNKWTMKLDAMIEAKTKVEELQKDIEDTVAELNQMDWKVKVGLGLTADEKTAYVELINKYVEKSIESVQQQQYTADLAIDAVFSTGAGGGAKAKEFSKQYYNELNADMSNLGGELSDLVNSAFEDGMLDEAELDKINEKKAEIQKRVDEISQAEYDLKLDQIKADAAGGGLSPESFSALQEQLTEALEERKKSIEDGAFEVMKPWRVKLNKGEISKEEYDAELARVRLESQASLSQVTVDAVDVEIGTIKSNYQSEIDKVFPGYQDSIKTASESLFKSSASDFNKLLSESTADIKEKAMMLDSGAQDTIRKALEKMQPEKADLMKTAEECVKAGKVVPESILKGLSDISEMEALTGETSAIYMQLGEEIANSPEKMKAIKKAQESGIVLPMELTKAIEMYSGEVYSGADGMWKTMVDPNIVDGVSASAAESVRKIKDTVISQANELTPEMKESLGLLGFDTGKSLTDNLNAGVLGNIEVVRSASTGMVIGFKNGVTNDVTAATPEMLALFNALGIGCNQSMGEGVSKETLSAPNVSQPNSDVWAVDLCSAIRKSMNGKSVSLAINGVMYYPKEFMGPVPPGSKFFADGGIADRPSIAGEAGPEMIIPLDPSKRSRAVALFNQTAEMIGMDVPAGLSDMRMAVAANQSRMSANAASLNNRGSFDPRSIVAAVREGLRGAKVEANGRQIGEVVFENWDRMVRTHGGR